MKIRLASIFGLLFVCCSASAFAAEPPANPFAQKYYVLKSDRDREGLTETKGLLFFREKGSSDAPYSVVTDFAPGAYKSRKVSGASDPESLNSYVERNLTLTDFHGVQVRHLKLSEKGKTTELFWVGHRAFPSQKEAEAAVIAAEKEVRASGGNFEEAVKKAQEERQPQEPLPVPPPTRSQVEKEEALVLKYLDKMNIGTELFGPLQDKTHEEAIIWQSFGETSWRRTNLESHDFRSLVGNWTNRVVFRGIKFPLNSIDLYLQLVLTGESNTVNFKNAFFTGYGAEWRFLERQDFFKNYDAGGLRLLDWVRYYRLFIQYTDRINLLDPILNSKNYDIQTGFQIFYEWGIDPPAEDKPARNRAAQFARDYVWGEYFGAYFWDWTGFNAEDDYNTWILNDSVILGLKLPGIPLPANPVMDSFELMPYMRFEHVNATEVSFFFQNRWITIGGVRWMPFRNPRFKDNEWLYKMKLFFEYVGVGRVTDARKEGSNEVDYDFRFGVNFSQNHY